MNRFKNILVGSAVSVLMFTLAVPPASAQSATMTDLQAQIAALMAQIAALNSGGTTTPVFVAGDKIITTSAVKVRAIGSLSGAVLGSQKNGSLGTIVAGPVRASNNAWYRVNFDVGIDGWVAAANFGHADLPDEEETSLTFSLSPQNPESSTLVVGDKSTEYTVLEYEIAAAGNEYEEVEFQQLAVTFVTNGAPFSTIVNDATLEIGGNTFNDVTFSPIGIGQTLALFDLDNEVSLDVDDELDIKVRVLFEDNLTTLASKNSVSIQASVADYARNLTIAEGSEAVKATIGLAVGNEHTLMSTGLMVYSSSVKTVANTQAVNSQLGNFEISFDVTALEEDIYIKKSATQSLNSGGVNFRVDGPSENNVTATLLSDAEEDGGYYLVEEGTSESFVTRVSVTSKVAGSYRVVLESIMYGIDSPNTNNNYVLKPASDFQTKYISLAGSNVSPIVSTFTLADVSKVTKQEVDNTSALDDGYTIYTITLKNKIVKTLKIPVRPSADMRIRLAKEVGFSGSGSDLEKLLALATVAPQVRYDLPKTKTAFVQYLYRCVLDRTPDQEGLARWTDLTSPAPAFYKSFFNSPEFNKKNLNNPQFVDKLYQCVLFREAEQAGKNGWVARLAAGDSRLSVLEKITASTEYTVKIKPTLDKLVQTTLTPPTLPVATLPTPRFNSLSGERTLTIEASAVFGRPASGTLAVTGPVRVGTVNWGNGVTAPVFALVTGDQMTVPLRHTYRTSGPYTITLTDLANKSVSRQVVVSASSTGQVRGASTDVYAQMAEALQAMSALLRSLEVK